MSVRVYELPAPLLSEITAQVQLWRDPTTTAGLGGSYGSKAHLPRNPILMRKLHHMAKWRLFMRLHIPITTWSCITTISGLSLPRRLEKRHTLTISYVPRQCKALSRRLELFPLHRNHGQHGKPDACCLCFPWLDHDGRGRVRCIR